MRTLEIILWVLLVVLVGGPLLAFGVAFYLSGFEVAVAVAGIFLGTVLFLALLLPLALNGGLVWGLFKVRGKARGGLRALASGAGRGERLLDRLSGYLALPDIWLYSRAAWVRGFFSGLRQPRRS
ncbi:MAG: hypothetical protein ACYC4L_08740 [Chloroflexota bacterium]